MKVLDSVVFRRHFRPDGRPKNPKGPVRDLCLTLGLRFAELRIADLEMLKRLAVKKVREELTNILTFDVISKEAETTVHAHVPELVGIFYTRARKRKVGKDFERLRELKELMGHFGLVLPHEFRNIEQSVYQSLRKKES